LGYGINYGLKPAAWMTYFTQDNSEARGTNPRRDFQNTLPMNLKRVSERHQAGIAFDLTFALLAPSQTSLSHQLSG
jgi:hypothetical protein